MVLWIPENALKSRVLYLEMLSVSSLLAVRQGTTAEYELQLLCLNRADKVHFTQVPSGSGE